MNSTLPTAVTAAITRAAKRISSYTSCDVAGMESIMAEELAPALAAPPSPPDTPQQEPGIVLTPGFETYVPQASQWHGCISSRPCHRCRVVWHSGTCVCGLTHCYRCGHWLRGEGDTTDYERINSDHYAGPKAAQINPPNRFVLTNDGRMAPAP